MAIAVSLQDLANKVAHRVIIGHMDSKTFIQRLEAEGWVLVRVRGSHHQFIHPDKPGRVTVKHPDKDIPIGTLRSIEKQAGWR
jgi:predicted RNA binding protein YcfA (HicA-like mRNA interferase family)